MWTSSTFSVDKVYEIWIVARALCPGPPGPPGGLLVRNVAETSVELRWSRGYDNHSPIGNYVIMGRSSLSSKWKRMRTGLFAVKKIIKKWRHTCLKVCCLNINNINWNAVIYVRHNKKIYFTFGINLDGPLRRRELLSFSKQSRWTLRGMRSLRKWLGSYPGWIMNFRSLPAIYWAVESPACPRIPSARNN